MYKLNRKLDINALVPNYLKWLKKRFNHPKMADNIAICQLHSESRLADPLCYDVLHGIRFVTLSVVTSHRIVKDRLMKTMVIKNGVKVVEETEDVDPDPVSPPAHE